MHHTALTAGKDVRDTYKKKMRGVFQCKEWGIKDEREGDV